MKRPILIWDIDGTLLDSSGAGIEALSRAIETHFGQPSPPLNLAGATDGGIYREMCRHFSRPFEAVEQEEFFALYLPLLAENLRGEERKGSIFPTVRSTLEHFTKAGYLQGLLTGNIKEGAYLKNESQGIASFFPFGAYGCDHHDRNELGFIAAQRAGQYLDEKVASSELLIIGDTPRDIACARACGAKVVAVTTGHADAADLTEADWVIEEAASLLPIVQGEWAEVGETSPKNELTKEKW